ncbi:MAG: hypothetical protein ABS52_11235 [Gemmatimonadetes bacterium SCN 70-22]|nr:MAG: hypothetical protein ABS52_11235 [Gemmatimonadetes bacterium SCN 70-22]
MTFFDGQNLFGCAKALYGYTEANYDPQLLSEFVAKKLGFDLVGVRFYTGVHDQGERPKLFAFWRAKLNRMVNRGIVTTQRPLAYTRETLTNPDGTTRVISTGREKGIDLRLGLDMVRLAREQAYDAVVLFSEDNDLGEATNEVKRIAQEQGRFVHVYSAFPCGKDAGHRGHRGKRGVERTNWLRLTRAEYDACLEVLSHSAASVPATPRSAQRGTGAAPASQSLGPTAAAAANSAPRVTSFGAALQAAVDDAARRAGGAGSGGK